MTTDASADAQPPLDPAARDVAASDPSISDVELFTHLNTYYEAAAAALGDTNTEVRALGLEAAIFGAIPWDLLAPDAEVIDLLAVRMTSPSPRIRMQIGDYLWQRGTPEHRRHVGAAAQAALEWARILFSLESGDNLARGYATRALATAVRLGIAGNQSDVVDAAKDFTIALMTDAAAAGDTRPFSLLCDLLIELRERFTSAQRQQVVLNLAQLQAPAMAAVTPLNPPLLVGRLFEVRRELAYAEGDDDAGLRCDREYAAILADHAADRGDALIESVFLGDAITLAERGQEDPAVLNDYRRRQREATERAIPTMKTVRFAGQLDPAMSARLQARQDDMIALPIDQFLHSFARLGVPTRAQLEASVAGARVNAPMSTGTPRVHIAAPDQHVVAGSDDDTLLREHGCRFLQISAGLHLRPVWERRLDSGDLTAEAVMEALRTSGSFDPAALDVIADGITAAIAGNTVVAIHVLAPQFEDVLRQLLDRAGHSPAHHNPSDPNITEVITLGPILNQLETLKVITPDDALFFSLVLDDPLCLNLRNRVGHGLVRRGECTPEAVLLLLQCYLLVASLPVSAQPVTAAAPSGPNDPD
ncbi:MAG TPA: DUF4209 domain-containing protein, partial [Candidatus Dormibacteraeota bacterium]